MAVPNGNNVKDYTMDNPQFKSYVRYFDINIKC